MIGHHDKEPSDQPGSEGKSTLVSRNITVFGRRTSVRLEPEMWEALREIAKREKCTIHDICTLIYVRKNENTSLTAAIRVFIMLYFRAASTEDGHQRAGHGNFEYMKERARIPTEYMTFFKSMKRNDNIPASAGMALIEEGSYRFRP
jgi:predicted DNA-binding ribbon-helix-helix protein